MPKLKGLLDSANAKLAGLLGDFPQGFNAGAVAGFPGWAGDMAYLADTARLALTGADSQAAPEDYVGTTDYIAKQAGYPVPQTLSGQLGAAVGGLMSPGPGDLAKFAPLGAMFLGAKAKTAMPDVLEYAQAMEKAGKSADEIWQTTGKLGQPWFKGADGKWRFEISDNEAAVHPLVADGTVDTWSLADKINARELLAHDPLYQAYPDLANVPTAGRLKTQMNVLTDQMNGRSMDAYGSYSDKGMAIASPPDSVKVTALHELQHGVQRGEGFARGGSPDGMAMQRDQLRARIHYLNQEMGEAARGMDRAPKHSPEYVAYKAQYDSALAEKMDMDPSLVQGDPYESYRRLAGEAEARNVQARMNLTMDERIALPPWATQDVPTEQQIVRFGDGPAMSMERNGEPIAPKMLKEPVTQQDIPTPDDWLNGDGVAGYGLHITDSPNGAKISKEGIKAGKDGYSYLWDRGMDAESEAFMRDARISRDPNMNWDEVGAIQDDYVVVDTSKLKTEVDPMTGALRVKGDIPPSAIVNPKSEPLKAAEDFAARRAGKAKPYREAINGM